MSNLEFVIAVFFLVLTLLGLKIGLQFDINRWLESRRQHRKERLKNLCPHVWPVERDGQYDLVSLFKRTSGIRNYYCSQCGLVALQDPITPDILKFYANNIKVLIKKDKIFRKHAKKLRLI